MTEATWGDAARTPPIDWRMSAAPEHMPRGDDDVPEVTNLAAAVRAWRPLDPDPRQAARLTSDQPVQVDGVAVRSWSGEGIAALAKRLPAGAT